MQAARALVAAALCLASTGASRLARQLGLAATGAHRGGLTGTFAAPSQGCTNFTVLVPVGSI